MGEQVLQGLYACEIRYLCMKEFALSAHDILWRRTKLGLHLPANAAEILEIWLADPLPRWKQDSIVETFEK